MIFTYVAIAIVYITFFLLLALSIGVEMKEVSPSLLSIRIVGLVCVIYIINLKSGFDGRLAHFLGGVGYLIVVFVVGSFGGDVFFAWMVGKKRKRDEPNSKKTRR